MREATLYRERRNESSAFLLVKLATTGHKKRPKKCEIIEK